MRTRRGVALVEATVALLLIGMVALIGRTLLDAVVEAGRSVADIEARRARENADFTHLRGLLERSRTGAIPLHRFEGTESSIAFGTSCPTGAGWLERCEVVISLRHHQDSADVVMESSSGTSRILSRHAAPARFRFLLDAADGGVYAPTWGSQIVAPLAVVLETPQRATILRVGGPR